MKNNIIYESELANCTKVGIVYENETFLTSKPSQNTFLVKRKALFIAVCVYLCNLCKRGTIYIV